MIFLKRLSPFVLLLLFIVSGSIGLVAGDTPPADVLKAAQKGICDFRAAETSRVDAGQSRADIMMVENGEIQNGFQVYTLSPNHLVKKANFGKILTPTGLWRFVVTNEGAPISLITVAVVQGKWTAVSWAVPAWPPKCIRHCEHGPKKTAIPTVFSGFTRPGQICCKSSGTVSPSALFPSPHPGRHFNWKGIMIPQ